MAYGTPARLDEVEPYYTDIRRGRKPPPDLLEELRERYRSVGGRTPLLEISRAQASALQRMLGDDYGVFLGMKHWHPYIRDAMAAIQAAEIGRAVGVVLAPHFSRGSIGEYVERVEAGKRELAYDLDITIVLSWHLNSHYLDALEAHIRDALAKFGSGTPRAEVPETTRPQPTTPSRAPMTEVGAPSQAALSPKLVTRNPKPETRNSPRVTLVFTAHSLPQRVVSEGDPYQIQLLETSRALAARLGFPEDQWTFSFQSAGRTSDPWLGPDVVETVNRLADEGVANILVVPIGFISDHLEIFYDIDTEARQAAARRGVRLERIESLNDDPRLIAALADVVTQQHVRAEAGE
jgi:protoporphyrin/coproporphyrin ferrochelatase